MRKYFALVVVIFSVQGAVAWDGGYVVPDNSAIAPPNDPYWRAVEANLKHDNAEAMKWYRMAADHGDARAQNALGIIYEGGVVAPQNYAEALKWWRRAADQGYAAAQWSLGLSYASGEGAP